MKWMRAVVLLLACQSVVQAAEPSAVGATSLVEAARQGNHDLAVLLLSKGENVNAGMADGTMPLHWAIHNGDVDLVKRLVKAKANVSASNDYGSTPMAEAAELGNAEIIKQLLKAGADVESPNREGQTALMTVARSNHIDAAKVLLSHGAKVNTKEQWREQTALMWAAAQSQPEMVKLLIQHGANVNERSKIRQWDRKVTAEPRPQNRPPGGLTPLLYAARNGCAPCAKALVDGGADINLVDPNDISPLLMATLNARWDVAAYLISAKADVNKWDTWGRAPLYSTVDYNTTPRGGRPDRPSLDPTTALQVTEMLLKAGANPNMMLKLFPPYRSLGQDRGGDSMLTVGTTPLIRAAKGADSASIKLLLAHGALVNLPNSLGITPLMAAVGLGTTNVDTRARFRFEDTSLEAAKLLLAAGADINASRDNGQTALHGAASWGWNVLVQWLADNGAKLDAKDRNGNTAVDVAQGKTTGPGRIGNSAAEPHLDTVALLQKLLEKKS
jgi:uncharacterized protein